MPRHLRRRRSSKPAPSDPPAERRAAYREAADVDQADADLTDLYARPGVPALGDLLRDPDTNP